MRLNYYRSNPSNRSVCFTQSSIPHLSDCSTFAHVYFFWVAAYVLIMLKDTCDSYEDMFGTSQEAVKVIYSSTINTVSILWHLSLIVVKFAFEKKETKTYSDTLAKLHYCPDGLICSKKRFIWDFIVLGMYNFVRFTMAMTN